jgi:hypothetical protein
VDRGVDEVQGMLRGDRNSPVTMIFRRGAGGAQGEQIVVTLLRAVPGGGAPAPRGTPQHGGAPAPHKGAPPADVPMIDSTRELKKEFAALSFLWGEPVENAVQESMAEWKKNMLYGPKRERQEEPIPPPPNVMQAQQAQQAQLQMQGFPQGMYGSGRFAPPGVPGAGLPDGLAMRRSFNAGSSPAAAAPAMYRSMDQGVLASFASRAGQAPLGASYVPPSQGGAGRAFEPPVPFTTSFANAYPPAPPAAAFARPNYAPPAAAPPPPAARPPMQFSADDKNEMVC